jgi:hypothetical protein
MAAEHLSGLYASGFDFPVRPSGAGGFELVEGEVYVDHLVLIALGSGESDNPFQDLGMNEDIIFEIGTDPRIKAAVASRVRSAFAILERDNLARLHSLAYDEVTENGDFVVHIDYINLETRNPRSVAFTVSPGGDFSPSMEG